MKLERLILCSALLGACSGESDGGPEATSNSSSSTQGMANTGPLPPDMEMPRADGMTQSASSVTGGVTSGTGGGGQVGGTSLGMGATGVGGASATGAVSTAGAPNGMGGSAAGDAGAVTTAVTTAGGTSSTTRGTGGTGNQLPDGQCQVQELSAEFRQNYDNLDPFYQKYADANGLPVISSLAPADEALSRACELVIDMVSARSDVREALIANHIRFAIIGEDELTNDIPEYSYLDDSINTRARGLGGTPAASCAEESILCNTELDRWRGEGICVHEFAHTIATAGLFEADPTFESRLRSAYQSAEAMGLFANTYAMENFQEYWAEGVQDWYYTNLEADPPNGIHNFVDRREELQQYDPTLYGLIAEFLPDAPQFVDCYSDE